jgi:hypothetical protein
LQINQIITMLHVTCAIIENDGFGNTMGYVFIGEGSVNNYYGSKPMSFEWKLNEPMPHYLWKDAAKLRIG